MNHLNLVRTCELTEKEGEPRVVVEKHAGWGRNGSAGWVAQLGVKEGVLQRAFLNPSRSQLSRAGNGDCEFKMPEGVFQAESVWRSYETHSVYLQVSGGQITLLAQAEAEKAVGYDREAVERAQQAARQEMEQAAGLPDLLGSEKQISWARDIRARILRQHPEKLDELRKQKSAKWFIDHR